MIMINRIYIKLILVPKLNGLDSSMIATSFTICSQRLSISSSRTVTLRSWTVAEPRYRVNTCYVARYLNGSATIWILYYTGIYIARNRVTSTTHRCLPPKLSNGSGTVSIVISLYDGFGTVAVRLAVLSCPPRRNQTHSITR
jgi:hypothetical protein